MTKWWYDKETRSLRDTPPPLPFNVFGQAPMYMSDEMPPCRHPMTGETISSRRHWQDVNRATGCRDADRNEKISKREPSKAEVDADWDAAMEKSIAQLDTGMLPMTEEQKAAHKTQNDYLSSKLGVDAHNIFRKGKKCRKK